MSANKPLRVPGILSALTGLLVLAAASGGLLLPGFYEPFMPTPALLYGGYGQDLMALLVAVLLLLAIPRAVRGSTRAFVFWCGSLGFFIYAYFLWSFEAIYTAMFPIYLLIAALSLYTFIGLLGGLDVDHFRRRFLPGMPVRGMALVLVLPALMAPPWLAFVLQGITAGEPATINTVLVLDLAIIIPGAVWTSISLWRQRSWGYLFAGIFLVKMLTMSGSLVISTLWAVSRGAPVDPVLPLYVVMTLLGGWMLRVYLRQIKPAPADLPVSTLARD